jgi:hypothetical protein
VIARRRSLYLQQQTTPTIENVNSHAGFETAGTAKERSRAKASDRKAGGTCALSFAYKLIETCFLRCIWPSKFVDVENVPTFIRAKISSNLGDTDYNDWDLPWFLLVS